MNVYKTEAPRVLRVMGVDPGFASTGALVLEQRGQGDDNYVGLLHASVIRTEKITTKVTRGLRVSDDDQRRLREIWQSMQSIWDEHPVHAMAVETFTPWTGKRGSGEGDQGFGGGNAWKSGLVYSLVSAFGYSRRIPVMPFVPMDLKRRIACDPKASKARVAEMAGARIAGLVARIAAANKGDREHIGDAGALALLGLDEMLDMRQRAGLA